MDNTESGMKEKILEIMNKCSKREVAAEQIAAHVEQHYYPKEFIMWWSDKLENRGTVEDLFQFWLTQIKK
jgi:hypothetical protein